MECAKQGAVGLILHYLGDKATTEEIEALKTEVESIFAHAKVKTIPGDIADPRTSAKVRP